MPRIFCSLSLLMALLPAALLSSQLSAQWDTQESHSTADLRGIVSVGGGIAWASGSNGTVLRTEDDGVVWQGCAIPPGAEKLDFRGIQAWDAQVAIVMSSGKGPLSRLFKTTDGCKSWNTVFDDPDETGFFDSLRRVTDHQIFLLGDPVGGKFSMFTSRDAGDTWYIADDPGLDAPAGAGAFAASNSALSSAGPFLLFGTGGTAASVYIMKATCAPGATGSCPFTWVAVPTPLAYGVDAAGVFSVGTRFTTDQGGRTSLTVVAVGGIYNKPDDAVGTAASSRDGGKTWTAATTMPHGYRSAVAFDSAAQTWITVGPNGTDASTDDGRNWHPLTPGATEAKDADRNWNALSLPFAVGPHGRIGKLSATALKPIRP
jgi:photosystem II stability/assembly factor-like uncharacterized protein